ncbi:MAG: GNAT family N-acetyltransferase [Thermoplasmatales archaeon]|nr:MAG: GNAT family N-acetyltransferase [Thermoplasmatales archaeon]
MVNQKVDIKVVDNWVEEEIVTLYKSAGWWKESYDPSGIKKLIKGSFAFAVVIDSVTGKAIGMGRILSDGVSDAYLQDLVVLPQYRKKGIGKKLVEFLLDYCLSRGILWIALISEPGQDIFYLSLGFNPMKKYIPMKYQKED